MKLVAGNWIEVARTDEVPEDGTPGRTVELESKPGEV